MSKDSDRADLVAVVDNASSCASKAEVRMLSRQPSFATLTAGTALPFRSINFV